MTITIVGRSLENVKNVLNVLQDYNAYSIQKGEEPPFKSDQLETAMASILAAKEDPDAKAPSQFNDAAQEIDAPMAIEVEYNCQNPLQDMLLHDTLFCEGMVPNSIGGKIYSSTGAAKEDIGATNKVGDAVDHFSGRRQDGRLHEELGAFFSFRDSLAKQTDALELTND